MGFKDITIEQSTLNVLQLGVGFFCNLFAFNTQGFVEEPVINSAAADGSIDEHAGYYSLAIIYAVFTLANFIAAPIVDTLSPKWSMVLGILCYAVFQVGFLFLNQWYLYISSAVLGFGAAILWTGQGSYLSQNCTKETTSRNSSMLWALAEGSLVLGGIFLYIVFHSSSTNDNISKETTRTLYAVFTIVSLVAAGILMLLRAPVYPAEKREESYGELLGLTFKLMTDRKIMTLVLVFAYSGIEQSFWTGIYPTCVSFTQQLGSNTNTILALNSICAGCGQILGGFSINFLTNKRINLKRDSIVLLGFVLHLVTFLLIYINFPADASLKKTDEIGGLITPNLAIALVCGFLLGLGDSYWNTQIYSLLCDAFSQHSAQAFSIYKFWQSALSCAAFFYSPFLQLQWHLMILFFTSIMAALCFFMTEKQIEKCPIAGSIEDNNKEVAED